MDAINLLDALWGDNIATDRDSASQDSGLICQAPNPCDCKGCPDSG